MLLGNHFTEQSAIIQWVSMPQKRSCRLKDHNMLEKMAEHNPDTGIYRRQCFGHTLSSETGESVSMTLWPITMKTRLRSVKLIIVDEISMVSSLTLTYMHLRLEELFGGDD